MNSLDVICDIIQEDVGRRGLRTDPTSNLITATAGDLQAACQSITDTPQAAVAVVTGFYIPHGAPPSGETDGPLGALFLARALTPLGIRIVLVTDLFCTRALEVGLAACGLTKSVQVVTLPAGGRADSQQYWRQFSEQAGPLTHVVALERVGPSHTLESLHGVLARGAARTARSLPHDARSGHHSVHEPRASSV
jgi:hypothetical protein